jgi:hypothetical protein
METQTPKTAVMAMIISQMLPTKQSMWKFFSFDPLNWATQM